VALIEHGMATYQINHCGNYATHVDVQGIISCQFDNAGHLAAAGISSSNLIKILICNMCIKSNKTLCGLLVDFL
jgi:hypothetical protein